MKSLHELVKESRDVFRYRTSAKGCPKFEGGPYLLYNHQHLFPSLFGVRRLHLGIPLGNLGHQLKYRLESWK